MYIILCSCESRNADAIRGFFLLTALMSGAMCRIPTAGGGGSYRFEIDRLVNEKLKPGLVRARLCSCKAVVP